MHIQHSNHNLQVLYASTTLCIKVENGKSSLFVCEHLYTQLVKETSDEVCYSQTKHVGD